MKNVSRWPWLSICLGFAATVIGVILTAMNAKSTSEDAGVYLILGGVLTAFGPVILSYEVSKRVGRREAQQELLGHIESISMNLGHSVAALDNALKRNAAGVDTAHVTLSVVHSLTSGIEVQIGQLQKLIGEPFSLETLLATREKLVNLAGTLAKALEENDSQAALEASRGIDKEMRKLVKPAGKVDDVTVTCPQCAHEFSQLVGTLPGSTSKATCPLCDSAFNVHRNGKGVAFVRITSSAPASQQPPAQTTNTLPAPAFSPSTLTSSSQDPLRPKRATLQCPKCDNGVRFWTANTPGDQVVVCLNCDTGITINSSGVVVGLSQYFREMVPVQRPARVGFVVLCPRCGNERNCKIKLEHSFFGYCVEDSVTLNVTAEAASSYREPALAETA